MNDAKPWYASSGVWGGIIAAVSGVIGLLGYTIAPEEAEELAVILATLGGSASGLIAIVGRVQATKQIK